MKLKAHLSGTDYEVWLDVDKDEASAEVDGRTYEIGVRELSPGVYLIMAGENVCKGRVDAKRGARDFFEVTLRGSSYDITITDPKRLRSGQTSGAHDHGSSQIVSPMPGKVVRVLVEVGAQVEAGAGIVVVEAMKMQNEMKSPKAGVVVSLTAEAGATVDAGDVLAVIE